MLGKDILEVLKGVGMSRWIWHGDGFAGIDEVILEPRVFIGMKEIAHKGAVDLTPYIYPVSVLLCPGVKVLNCLRAELP